MGWSLKEREVETPENQVLEEIVAGYGCAISPPPPPRAATERGGGKGCRRGCGKEGEGEAGTGNPLRPCFYPGNGGGLSGPCVLGEGYRPNRCRHIHQRGEAGGLRWTCRRGLRPADRKQKGGRP